MSGPCVVFDVIGTCFGYESVCDALQHLFKSQLAENSPTIPPQLFFATWTANAELDFQYLSIVGDYRSHSTLLKKAFYKTMDAAGLASSSLAEADVDELISQYCDNLTPRPGLSEMMQTLRDAGFTVWCCSDGSPERVKGYFEKAGIAMPMENLLSCNMCAAAKPDPKVYKMAKEKVRGAETAVFAAAHAWDLAGARKEGFSTAYCTVGEDESCAELFGKADVVAGTLPELGRAIVQKWGSRG
ncbi:HAD-like domain-containing protein [Mycena rosella]|uniref:HAD-like domain-containing protein n=1 Tax=Mycena rosella TaxID=1033263 RepID=A0AAD7CZZ3_MYCRO|nr:HAD-like domain-containing protein [Mycena rosella]